MDSELEELLSVDATPPKSPEEMKEMVNAVGHNLDQVFQQSDNLDPRFEEDFEYIRENLKEMVSEIRKTVFRQAMIAYDTEKAIDYQAMAQMATVLLHANKQILDIYEAKKKYLTKKEPKIGLAQQNTNVNVNNAVFTGTMSQLKDFLQKNKRED